MKVDYLTFESAAIKYNMNVSSVRKIVHSFKHKADYEGELLEKQVKKEDRLAAAERTVEGIMAKNQEIWSLKQVSDAAAAQHGVKLGPRVLSNVLKSHFDLRFHKVKRIPFQGNSERSLVVRQQSAKKLLELLDQGFRIVNVDESWINEVDFQRRKWHSKKETNSLPRKAVHPRLSLIAAIDNRGSLYMALTTINTTSEVVCLFVKQLVDALELEDPDFREKTVLQFDGATYHRSAETRNFLANMGVKTMISGPYGYEIASIERLFAGIKSTNLNPDLIRTGKK